MNDWIDTAAQDILSAWPEWESEAGKLPQSAQDAHMLKRIANEIRWHANQAQVREYAAKRGREGERQ